MNKRIFAFTISELLIALLVLGVLGAVLSPVITNIMPNQNKVIIKRTYHQVTNVVAKMLEDNSLYSPFGAAGSGNETTPIYAGFDNTSYVNFLGKTYSGDTKFSGIFSAMIGAKDFGTEDFQTVFDNGGDSLNFSSNVVVSKTKEGIKWRFAKPSETSSIASIITIDVNGDKGPNCSQGLDDSCKTRTKNFDRYVVGIYNDGKIAVSSKDIWARNVLNASSSTNND